MRLTVNDFEYGADGSIRNKYQNRYDNGRQNGEERIARKFLPCRPAHFSHLLPDFLYIGRNVNHTVFLFN